MTKINSTKKIEQEFFLPHKIDINAILPLLNNTLASFDGGELYLEDSTTQSIIFEDRKVKSTSSSKSGGFSLRGFKGESTIFTHSTNISEASIKTLAKNLEYDISGDNHEIIITNDNVYNLYAHVNPLSSFNKPAKIELMQQIDDYIRSNCEQIKEVTISFSCSYEKIAILPKSCLYIYDERPLSVIKVSVIIENNGRRETASIGFGGRDEFAAYANLWQNFADEVIQKAKTQLEAIEAPSGNMEVVLSPGWPGVLLHEAVGHGLEGDANRKNSSVYYDKMGRQVAAKGVTVIDDGTIAGRRGSLNFDDEGHPTQRNILIEDGVLVGYMQDLQNANLMGMKPTGNGRRESYAHLPMPRMTNTFMISGNDAPEEIIKSVKKGIYATYFGGGQVDTTSGDFVFSASEAFLIEDGKITAPIKGATLIGNGPKILQKISAIGNDSCLDHGIGMCGKKGQSIPVGVGQPTLKISEITVGGTKG